MIWILDGELAGAYLKGVGTKLTPVERGESIIVKFPGSRSQNGSIGGEAQSEMRARAQAKGSKKGSGGASEEAITLGSAYHREYVTSTTIGGITRGSRTDKRTFLLMIEL